MDDDSQKIKAVFLSPDAESKYDVAELLLQMEYDVFCREHRHEALTLLPAVNADLLILAWELVTGTADEMCEFIVY